MLHVGGLDLIGELDWGESDDDARLPDASLHSKFPRSAITFSHLNKNVILKIKF